MLSSGNTIRVLLILTLFSIAMGYMESAVVVYLREILYPEGFTFPLVPISSHLVYTELIREAATIIMLFAAGYITGRTKTEKFALFIYCFGIWDIFYYMFLKLLLGWPESLLTWDILFLIPVTWTGPVIAPVIISILMINFGLLVVWLTNKDPDTGIVAKEWLILLLGACIVLVSFILDYTSFMLKHYSLRDIWSFPAKVNLYDFSLLYLPDSFNWLIFFSGVFVIMLGIFLFYRRNSRTSIIK